MGNTWYYVDESIVSAIDNISLSIRSDVRALGFKNVTKEAAIRRALIEVEEKRLHLTIDNEKLICYIEGYRTAAANYKRLSVSLDSDDARRIRLVQSKLSGRIAEIGQKVGFSKKRRYVPMMMALYIAIRSASDNVSVSTIESSQGEEHV